jgi:hypothetical protein
VLGIWLGVFSSFVVGILNPAVVNKAGPDWLWSGGRSDPIRNLYFRPNGSFRRYGLAGLMLTLGSGLAALAWLLQH